MFDYENMLLEGGAKLIAGIDEAGRGPLAGPVVVASVIMPLGSDKIIDGINDSKKLSEKKREMLFDKIIATAVDYHIAIIDEKVIDEINILEATKRGMKECITSLKSVDAVLIDAVQINSGVKTISIIHGDALSYNIASASILAKVTRDRMMLEYDKQYPQYHFAKHKGYGTKEHIELLQQYGPCPLHRKSFIGHFVKVDENNFA